VTVGLGAAWGVGAQAERKSRRQNAESRTRKAEGRTRKAESRTRNAEGGTRKAEGGKRKAEGGTRKAEGRTRKAESGTRKAEGGTRKVEGRRRSDLSKQHHRDGGEDQDEEQDGEPANGAAARVEFGDLVERLGVDASQPEQEYRPQPPGLRDETHD